MKDIIKPIAVLGAICLVVTALLAYINGITQPIIKAAEEEAAAQARSEVLKEANSFEMMKVKNLPDGVTEVYKGSGDSGYVFMMTQKGYGGDIKLICGIKNDGTIEAVKTLSHSETSGIGSRVVDNGSGYREKYVGKTANDYQSVDAITGATISSTAYKKAVGSAFEAYKVVKGAE